MAASQDERNAVLVALRRGEIDDATAAEILDDLDWEGAETAAQGLSIEEARVLRALQAAAPSMDVPSLGGASPTPAGSAAPAASTAALTGGTTPNSASTPNLRVPPRTSAAAVSTGVAPPAVRGSGSPGSSPVEVALGGRPNVPEGAVDQAAFMRPIESTIQDILRKRRPPDEGVTDPKAMPREGVLGQLAAGAQPDRSVRGTRGSEPQERVPTEQPTAGGEMADAAEQGSGTGKNLAVMLGALGLGGVLALAAGGKNKQSISTRKVPGGTIVTSTYRESPATRLGKALGTVSQTMQTIRDRELAMEELRMSQAKEARHERMDIGLNLIRAGQVEQGKAFLAQDHPMLADMISIEEFDPDSKREAVESLTKAHVWKTLPPEAQLQVMKDIWSASSLEMPVQFERRFLDYATKDGTQAFSIAAILKMADSGVVLPDEVLRKAGIDDPSSISEYARVKATAMTKEEMKDQFYQLKSLSSTIEDLIISDPDNEQLLGPVSEQLAIHVAALGDRLGSQIRGESGIEPAITPRNAREYEDLISAFAEALPSLSGRTRSQLLDVARRGGLRPNDPKVSEMIDQHLAGR